MTYSEREGTTMPEMQSAAQTYALGHTAEAFQRLLVQGQLFHPFTRRLLEEAGLRAGMQVLFMKNKVADSEPLFYGRLRILQAK